MTYRETIEINRLRRQNRLRIRLTSPGVPWYRDVKILRILGQIIFLALVIISGYFIISNLVNNLRASNLSLDFRVYQRNFSVAISEGISVTSEWTWLQKSDSIEAAGWVIWLALLGGTAYTVYRHLRRRVIPTMPLLVLAALVPIFLLLPPWELPEILRTYLYPSSMTRALITGIYNTLKVVILSLFACTILGIFVGIGLLSSNFLVRNTARIYVEIFRNTPLAVQLIFIYRMLTLILPFPRQSLCSAAGCAGENLYAFNARGFYFARPETTDTTMAFYAALAIGLAAAWFVRRWRLRLQETTGTPAKSGLYSLSIFAGISAAGWLLAGGWPLSGGPFSLNYPVLQGPNIQGGTQFSIGFVALFTGLTLYTTAFIADIVRAGIQAVPYGQIEAARSQGLKGSQVLSLVVLPQALRLIIPPLGNQYVNLGKNSSLGIIVNYVDTYRVAQLANNESGQAVPFFVGLMLIYLTLSLTFSALTNLANRSAQLRTR